MKTKNPNLPEPTLTENNLSSGFKNTLDLVSDVLKLAKKVFML
ncbi:hypothetical protein [Winogradskyella sp. UBA3174]|nr:hypothetical protein [Winogradskyella sp. UBA3174]